MIATLSSSIVDVNIEGLQIASSEIKLAKMESNNLFEIGINPKQPCQVKLQVHSRIRRVTPAATTEKSELEMLRPEYSDGQK